MKQNITIYWLIVFTIIFACGRDEKRAPDPNETNLRRKLIHTKEWTSEKKNKGLLEEQFRIQFFDNGQFLKTAEYSYLGITESFTEKGRWTVDERKKTLQLDLNNEEDESFTIVGNMKNTLKLVSHTSQECFNLLR